MNGNAGYVRNLASALKNKTDASIEVSSSEDNFMLYENSDENTEAGSHVPAVESRRIVSKCNTY
jgi:hypothetical protein